MNAVAAHFAFEFRVGFRNQSLLLLNYLFPLGFYLLGSVLMSSLNPNFRDILVPGMVFFAVVASTLIGMPDPLVNARESGIFRSYKIHGIPEAAILFIPALTTILHMTVVAIIIVLTAPILFNAALPINWGGFILAFVLVASAFTGIGLLIGVIVPNSRTGTMLSQAIFLPSMLIGGLMFPASQLPESLRAISRLFPTTHAMNIFEGLAQESATPFSPWLSVAVLLTGAVVAFALAIYLFNWDRQNRTQRGHPALALLAIIPYALSVILSLM